MILKVSVFNIILCFVLNFCHSGHARLAPDFIRPCNDTSSECLIKATQDAIPRFVEGIPQFGIPPLDPFVIEKLPIVLNGITVTFHKGTVSGFKTCIVDNFVAELEKRHFILEFHCNITVKGQYEAKGKLILFQIDGAGDALIELTNIRVKLDVNSKYVKDDKGLIHWAIKNYTYTFDFGDRVWFDIQNLFKESKEWSARVLSYLNENWKVLCEELGEPIIDYAVKLVVKTVVKFFHAVPCSELLSVAVPSINTNDLLLND